MRHFSLFAVVGLLVTGTAAAADMVLHVNTPAGYDAAKATVTVGQYGEGLSLGRANREGKTSEFTKAIDKGTKSIKVLIYYPGCKFVTAEFAVDKMPAQLEPKLEKLPTVPLTITLTGSDGVPILGRGILFNRTSIDMEYFGYSERMPLGYEPAPDASGVSANEGNLTVQVPDLSAEPYYAAHKIEAGFSLRMQGHPPTGLTGFDLAPNYILAQKSYPNAIQVKMVFRGRISGKVSPQFLANRGVDAKMGQHGAGIYNVWFQADRVGGGGGEGVGVRADGTFGMSLSAGKYDFSIQIRDDNGVVTKSIPVAKDYYLGENDDKHLEIKD